MADHRVSLEDYILNMKQFIKISRENNVEVVFLTRPHQPKSVDFEKLKHHWRAKVPLYNKELLEFGRREDVLVIDIQNIFETNYSDLFSDQNHFNLEGRKKMGEILCEQLAKNSLLPELNSQGTTSNHQRHPGRI